MKGNDTDKNIKYPKNIYVSRYIEIRKKEIENYNTANICKSKKIIKTLLIAKLPIGIKYY